MAGWENPPEEILEKLVEGQRYCSYHDVFYNGAECFLCKKAEGGEF